MNLRKKMKKIAILAFLALLPLTACGKDNVNSHRQTPPPEAVAACKDKAVGKSVTFTGRRGESIKAICQIIEGQLVAVPERINRNRGRPRQN